MLLKMYILMFYNSPVTTCFPVMMQILWRGHSLKFFIRAYDETQIFTLSFTISHKKRGILTVLKKKKKKKTTLPHTSYTPFLRPWKAWNDSARSMRCVSGGLDLVSLEQSPGKCGTAIILPTVMTTARIDLEHTIRHVLSWQFSMT